MTENTRVTKDQAIAAVVEAFKGKPDWHTVPIKDIVLGAPLPDPGAGAGTIGGTPRANFDTTGRHWKTTGQRMNHWCTKPQETPRSPLTLGGQNMVSGNTHRGAAEISWAAVIGSGPLTRDQRMAKIRTMFAAMDQDKSNVVTKGEFVSVMQSEGIEVNEAHALFKQMDESRTGRLTIAKFDHAVAVHTLKMIRDTFKALDHSHDRQIQREEFVRYFLGNGLDQQQASRLWDSIDQNHNGQINFVEYRDWAQETLQTESLDQVALKLGLS